MIRDHYQSSLPVSKHCKPEQAFLSKPQVPDLPQFLLLEKAVHKIYSPYVAEES